MNRNTKFIIISNIFAAFLLWFLLNDEKQTFPERNLNEKKFQTKRSSEKNLFTNVSSTLKEKSNGHIHNLPVPISFFNKIDFKVFGSVFNSNNMPVISSKCKLELIQLKMHFETTTNEKGYFEFNGKIDQLYMIQGIVEISHIFFKSYKNDKIYIFDGNGYNFDLQKIILEEDFEIQVSGTVFTEENDPIANNKILLFNSDFKFETSTNSEGKFSFRKKMHYVEILKFSIQIKKEFFKEHLSEIILNQNNKYSSNDKFILNRIVTQGSIEGHVKTSDPEDFLDLKAKVREKSDFSSLEEQISDVDSVGYFKVSFQAKLGLTYKGNVRIIAPEKELDSQDFEMFMDKLGKVHIVDVTINRPKTYLKLSGTIKHGLTQKKISNVKGILNLKSDHFKIQALILSNQEGEINFEKKVFLENYSGTIIFSKENYVDKETKISLNSENDWKQRLEILMSGKLTNAVLTGGVSDEETKQGIPFANVNILIVSPIEKSFEGVKTDNDGKFKWTFNELEHGSDYELKVSFSKEYYFQKVEKIILEEENNYEKAIAVTLAENRVMKTFVLSGQIQQESTEIPIANAEIELEIVSINKLFESKRKYQLKTKSDENGHFRLESVVKEGFDYEGGIKFYKENYFPEKRKLKFEIGKYEKDIGTIFFKGKEIIYQIIFSITDDYLKVPLLNSKIVFHGKTKQGEILDKTVITDETGKSLISDKIEYGKTIFGIAEISQKHFIPFNQENIVLNQENNYKSSFDVFLKREKVTLKISGKIIHLPNKTPIENVGISLQFIKYISEKFQTITNSNGEFIFQENGFRGISYTGSLKIEKAKYLSKEIKGINLSEENSFQSSLDVISLIGEKQSVKINGIIQEFTLKDPVPSASITLSITKPIPQEPFQGYSDEKGNIILNLELEFGSDYEGQLFMTKNFFQDQTQSISFKQNEGYANDLGIILLKRKINEINFKGIVEQKANGKLVPNANIKILILKPISYSTTTLSNKEGTFSANLKVEEGINYEGSIEFEKKNFESNSKPFTFVSSQNYIQDFQKILVIGSTKKSQVQLTIQDSRDKSPIPKALVELSYSTSKEGIILKKTLESNENGIFKFSNEIEYNVEYEVSTVISKENYNSETKMFHLTKQNSYNSQSEIMLQRIERKETIDGSVLLELSKRKLENVKVDLELKELKSSLSTITNSEGFFSFEFKGFQGEDCQFTLTLSKTNYKSNKIENLVIGSSQNYAAHLFDIILFGQDFNSELTGTLVNKLNKESVSNLKVSLKVDTPISYSQDSTTDSDGNFKFSKSLQYGEDYKGSLTINDSQFKSVEKLVVLKKKAFYIENVGKINILSVNLQATITGKLKDKIMKTELAEINVYFQNEKSKEISNSKSESNGNFAILIKTDEDQIINGNVFVNNTDFKPFSKTIELKSSNKFSEDLGVVELERKEVEVRIQGKALDNDKKELLDSVNVNIRVKSPEKMDYKMKTQGSFDLNFKGFQGLNYEGKVIFTKEFYEPQTRPFAANKENSYLGNVGEVPLQRIQVQLSFLAVLADAFDKKKLSGVKGVLKISEPVIMANEEKFSDEKGTIKFTLEGRKGIEYKGTISFTFEDFQEKEIAVVFNIENNYVLNLANVFLDRIIVLANLKGEIFDDYLNESQENVNVNLETSEPQKIKASTISDVKGNFKINFNALKGLQYLGETSFSKEFFKTKTISSKFSKENSYQLDLEKIAFSRESVKGVFSGKILQKNSGKILKNHPFDIIIHSPKPLKFSFVSDKNGEINESIDLKRGLDFSGEIIPKNENFEKISKKFILNEKNAYTANFGEIQLEGLQSKAKIIGKVQRKSNGALISTSKLLLKQNDPIKNHFEEIKSDKNGNFEFDLKCEYGMTCIYDLEAKKYGFYDVILKSIELSQENKYTKEVLIQMERKFVEFLVQGKLIHGRNDNPLSKAKISIKTDPLQSALSTFSDESGNFQIKGELEQEHKFTFPLKVTKENYQKADLTVELKEQSSYMYNFGNIKLKGENILGTISGKVKNKDTKFPEEGVILQILGLETDDKNEYKQLKSDPDGLFSSSYNYEYGENYKLKISSSKVHFYNTQNNLELNEKNLYKANLDLEIERKDVEGLIKGHIQRKIDKSNLKDVEISITLQGKLQNLQMNSKVVSGEEGNFEYKFSGKEGLIYDCELAFSKESYVSFKDNFKLEVGNSYQHNDEYYMSGKKIKMILHGSIIDSEKLTKLQEVKLKFQIRSPIIKEITELISDEEGKFLLIDNQEFGPEYVYHISATKDLYLPKIKTVILNQKNSYKKMDIKMKLSKTISTTLIEGQIIQKTNERKLSEMNVEISIPDQNLKLIGKSNSEGFFSLKSKIKESNVIECKAFIHKENFNNIEFDFNVLSKENYKKNLGVIYIQGKSIEALVQGKIFDKMSHINIEEASVRIEIQKPMEFQFPNIQTDNQGIFKAATKVEYNVDYEGNQIISKKNFIQETKPFELNLRNKYQSYSEIALQRKSSKGKLFGIVLHSITHQPIVNSVIEVTFNDKRENMKTTSNKAGGFSLEFGIYEGLEYSGKIKVSAEHFAPQTFEFIVNEDNMFEKNFGKIYLVAEDVTLTVSGKVQNKDWPLTNVKIKPSFISPFSKLETELKSDKDGKFEMKFPGSYAVVYKLNLNFQKHRFLEENKVVVLDPSNFYSQQIVVDLVRSQRQIKVSGNVVQQGHALQNVNAQVIGEHFKELASSTTNEKGEFNIKIEVQEKEEHKIELKLTKQNYIPKIIEITLNTENSFAKNLKDIEMKGIEIISSFSGIILDKSYNIAISKANVVFEIPNINKMSSVLSDSNGFYKISNPVGYGLSYNGNLRFSKENFMDFSKEVIISVENNYQGKLDVSLSHIQLVSNINGILIQRVTNQPVPKVNCNLQIKSPKDINLFTQSDSNGKFLFNFPVEKGIDYKGVLIFTKEGIENKEVPFMLNGDSTYILELGNILLEGKEIVCKISGQLRDHVSQQYLEKIPVEAILKNEILPSSKIEKSKKTESEADGAFLFHLKCERYVKHIYNIKIQGSQHIKKNLETTLDESNDYTTNLGLIDLFRMPKGVIEGTISDRVYQTSISNAKIEISYTKDGLDKGDQLSIYSGSDGKFSTNLYISDPESTYNVLVKMSHENYFDYNFEGKLNPQNNHFLNIKAALIPKKIKILVSGTVQDEQGFRIGDADISLKVYLSQNPLEFTAKSSSFGLFSFQAEANFEESIKSEIFLKKDSFIPFNKTFELNAENKFTQSLILNVERQTRKVIGYQDVNGRVIEKPCQFMKYQGSDDFYVEFYIKNYGESKEYPFGDPIHFTKTQGFFGIKAPVYKIGNQIPYYTAVLKIYSDISVRKTEMVTVAGPDWMNSKSVGIIRLENKSC